MKQKAKELQHKLPRDIVSHDDMRAIAVATSGVPTAFPEVHYVHTIYSRVSVTCAVPVGRCRYRRIVNERFTVFLSEESLLSKHAGRIPHHYYMSEGADHCLVLLLVVMKASRKNASQSSKLFQYAPLKIREKSGLAPFCFHPDFAFLPTPEPRYRPGTAERMTARASRSRIMSPGVPRRQTCNRNDRHKHFLSPRSQQPVLAGW